MNLKVKKGIAVLGIALFTGGMAFTSQAATYTYLISGDYADAGVWGSANVNSAAFSYGGGLVGKYSDAASGTFDFRRTDGKKKYVINKKLNRYNKTVSNVTKTAYKADKEGLTLTVKLNGDSEKKATIKCK